MGVLAINYSALSDAIKNAENAAKKAENYAEELDKKVCKKISDLEGGTSDKVGNADYFVKMKIKALEEKKERLGNLAGKLNDFYNKVTNTDKSIGDKFSELYYNFKKDNGIKVDVVTELFNYIGTKILNSTDFGKWLNNVYRNVSDFFNDIWGEIKYWYKCEGGKYVVDIVLSVAAIALAVFTIITAGAAIITAGAEFFAIVAIIGAFISIANAINNICTSAKALHYNDEDPAWANRYGEMDKFSDTLRKTVNSRVADWTADVLDITETFCDIVDKVSDLPENIADYKGIFNDGKLTNKEKWLRFGGKLFENEFLPDFDTIDDVSDFFKGCENASISLKALENTLKGAVALDEIFNSIDRIYNLKPKTLETMCDLFGVDYEIKEFEIGIKPKFGIYYNYLEPISVDIDLGVDWTYNVNIKIDKDRSVFEKIRDVFNPKNYGAEYGIKGMTVSDQMLESMGVFVQ